MRDHPAGLPPAYGRSCPCLPFPKMPRAWPVLLALGACPSLLALGFDQAIIQVKTKTACTINIGDTGSGKVQLRLATTGSDLGTLSDPTVALPLPGGKVVELTFLPDKANPFLRDIRITEAPGSDKRTSWAWYRVSQTGRGQPFTVVQTSATTYRVAYTFSNDPKPAITLFDTTEGERKTNQPTASPPRYRFALSNQTRTPLFFIMFKAGDFAGRFQYDPPLEDTVNTTEGSVPPGMTRHISFPADADKPSFDFNVVLSTEEGYTAKSNASIEQFKVSLATTHPFRVDADPFTVRPGSLKAFSKVRFSFDQSDPAESVLKITDK